jgi:hypothetical protein
LGRGVVVDLNGAAKYYKLAADQNDAEAQCHYGRCLEGGIGVGPDLIAAAAYYRRAAGLPLSTAVSPATGVSSAAASGDPARRFRLGWCLEFGLGIRRDPKGAAECYRLAADQGDAPSQVNIGFFLEHGIGIEEDRGECVKYYQSAAQQQNACAVAYCALCHQYGIGFDEDFDEAASFYLSSPNQGILENHSRRCFRSLNKARRDGYSRPKGRRRPDRLIANLASAVPARVSATSDDSRGSGVGQVGGRLIGTGGFGTVSVRYDLSLHRNIAVKHFARECDVKDFLREVDVMEKLNHPCVLRIVGRALPKGSAEAEIRTEIAAHGSLKAALAKVVSGEKLPFWNPTGIGILICSLVLGMRYIHSRRIIHSDLKPSNILINDKEHVWICDFGASRSLDDDPTSRNETGTVHYAAPEQYGEGSVCTTKCDVFTFGLVLYEMLVGVPVFHHSESPFEVIRRLRARDLPALPSKHGELMKSLLVQYWKEDPTDRPSFGEIFDMFKAADFQMLPEADHSRIRDFANRIVAWEETARKSESARPC